MAYKFNPFTSKLEEYGPILTGTGTVSAAADGTAALPGIAFTNDLNTGIYRPGADQLALSTGGTQRLNIDATGNMQWNGSTDKTQGVTSSGRGFTLQHPAAPTFSTWDTTDPSYYTNLTQLNEQSWLVNIANGPLIFGTNANERLRITSAGLVAIGNSSPSYKLDVQVSPDTTLAATADGILINGVLAGGNRPFGLLHTGNSYSYKGVGASRNNIYSNGTLAIQSDGGSIEFCSGANLNAVLDSSGRLGIGTTSPSGIFEACGSSSYFRPAGAAGTFLQITAGAANGDVTLTASANSGGYPPLIFSTGGGEKARLDASGRLLVGTASSPSAGDGQFSRLVVQGSVGGATSYVAFARNAAATAITADQGIGLLNFTDNAGNTFGRVECYADANAGSGDYPGRLVFSTTADGAASPTERMRIRNNGEVWIGTTTGSITSTTFGVAVSDITFNISKDRAAASSVLNVYGNAGQFRTMGDGDAENTNNSYGALSDIKLKENIVDAGSQWDDIKALRVRKYNLKEETGFSTHTQIGLVAQEVELVSPGLVGQSVDDETGEITKSVSYSVLYMKAVKALQEAMERIETLEAKVAALESA